MAGAQKNRLLMDKQRAERQSRSSGSQSATSSSAASTSGRDSHSAGFEASSHRSSGGIRARGFDGNTDPVGHTLARDPNKVKPIVTNKNIDFGMAGWSAIRGHEISTSIPARPPLSKMGQPIKVGLNTYTVTKFPTTKVFQYDVLIGSGNEKRGLIQKIWESKAVQSAIGEFAIFDGNKLAWSGRDLDRELKVIVDLNAEQGRQNKKNQDIHRVVIRRTNIVHFDVLEAYVNGKASFDSRILEAINFADHLLRHTPMQRFTSIKRAFFQHGESRVQLGGGIEAFKGIYQSLRIVHPGQLSINLDVANGTFWAAQQLPKAAGDACGARSPSELIGLLTKGEMGRAGRELRKMRKLHVLAHHRGRDQVDTYVIEKFIYKSAKQHKVKVSDEMGNEIEETVYDYFRRKYNVHLQHPDLPLCKMTKGKNTVLPMEVLSIEENQRYSYKMDDRMTANMIKFAVTTPSERYKAIQHGLGMLNWSEDPMLRKYGLAVRTERSVTNARLLTAPTVKFGVGDAKPGTSGRWDLKSKKFLATNVAPLKSWSVCVIPGRRGGKPDRGSVERFISAFVSAYQGLGGKVENKQPSMSLANTEDVGKWVTDAWNAAGNQANCRPQILFFLLPDTDSTVYHRIKRSCECRYGVVSQCMQYAQAVKCQPQYISNILMKFNSKLGGITSRAIGQKTGGPAGVFAVPTLVIGADVTHAAPGQQVASIAAMTVSLDKLATRYAALCQTNGFRIEMINTDTIMNDLKPMMQHWVQNVGGGKVPQVIIYLRDGVSEGQYAHVLQQEVQDIKTLLKQADPSGSTKFVVAVGSKRHHIRFFPEKGDRNGNAHPGTLVESGVTHPFENDFYLQSHSAIKGTARSTHYHVLCNEANMSNDQLHTLLYEHAYQFARSTTPVSIHPAIYYAHLAAARAISHDPKWSGSSDATPTTKPSSASQTSSHGRTGSSTGAPTDVEKLMPMPNPGGINTAMWYI